jgi:hypothetical protein
MKIRIALLLGLLVVSAGASATAIWAETCYTSFSTHGKKLNCYGRWDSTAYTVWNWAKVECQQLGGDEYYNVDFTPSLANGAGSITVTAHSFTCPEGTYFWLETLSKWRNSTLAYDSPPATDDDLQTFSCGN